MRNAIPSRWREEERKRKDRERKRREKKRKRRPHGGGGRRPDKAKGVADSAMMEVIKPNHRRRKDAVRKYTTHHVPGAHIDFDTRQRLAADWNRAIREGRRVSLRAFAKAHGLAYETWRREYGRGRTAADVPDPRNRRRRIYGEYDPFRAQDDVNDNAKGPRMLVTNVLERRFSHYVKEMLLSPYDAVQRLKADFPGRRIPGTSTWYHHIWRGDISVKYGETPYHPGRRRKPGPKPHPARTVPGHLQLRDRPFEAEWRMEPGHYEIDTVVSRLGGTGGLLVLVDRATRVYHVEKIGRVDQDSVVAAIRRMKRRGLLKDVKSVTSDNGSELNDDEKLSAALGCDVYYTRAYASYEKGSVENCNRLVRRWYPKGTDFAEVSFAEARRLERTINSIHRRMFGGMTAYEYAASLGKAA